MGRYVQSVVSTTQPIVNTGWRYVTIDTNLINNDKVFVDVSDSIINLILPSTPTNASTIVISHVAGDIVHNNIRVQALGKKINDLDLFILDAKFGSIELVYSEVTTNWIIVTNNSSSGGEHIIFANSNTQAKNNDILYIDTTNNIVDVILPELPIIGQDVTIIDQKGKFNINNCVVHFNGKKILSKSEDFNIDIVHSILKFTYSNSSSGWRIFDVFANNWLKLSINQLTNINALDYFLIHQSGQLLANQIYFVDTSNSTFTLPLPINPQLGDIVTIVDANSTFDTNTCILSGAVSKIQGKYETLILDIDNIIIKLIYSGISQGWLIVSVADSSFTFTPDMLTDISNLNIRSIGANSDLAINDFVLLDARVSVITLKLPTLPKLGDRITIFDVADEFTTYPPIIDGNGNLVDGFNTLTLDLNVGLILIYSGPVSGWITYNSNIEEYDAIPDISDINITTNIFRSISTNSTLVANNFAFVNTSASAVELALPSAPSIGDSITIIDSNSNFDINNCIISGGKIRGTMDTLVLDVVNESMRLIYTGTEFGWCIW